MRKTSGASLSRSPPVVRVCCTRGCLLEAQKYETQENSNKQINKQKQHQQNNNKTTKQQQQHCYIVEQTN